MWWVGNKKAHDLYLGTRLVALCQRDTCLSSLGVDGVEAAMSAATGLLAAQTHRLSLRLWLSGGICRPFLLPQLPQARTSKEVESIAAAMAGSRTGLIGDCEVWTGADRTSSGGVRVAIQRDVLERLRGGFSGRHRVLSIRPWWAEVLSHGLSKPNPPAAVGVQDCDSFTVLAGRAGVFDLATTFSPMLGDAAANSAWTRALLSADVPDDARLFARLRPSCGADKHACALGSMMELLT